MRGPPVAVFTALFSGAVVAAAFALHNYLDLEQRSQAAAQLGQESVEAAAVAADRIKSLQSELHSYQEQQNKDARVAARRRAKELLALADAATDSKTPFELSSKEHLGWVEGHQLRGFEQLLGSTSSVSEVVGPLQTAVANEGASTWTDARGSWALAPASNRRALAVVEPLTVVDGPSVQQSLRALSNLRVATPQDSGGDRWSWWWALWAAAVALIVGVVVWIRVDAPIRRSLVAARHFVHGDDAARPEAKGAAIARDLSRSITALMERVDRVGQRSRAVEDRDVQQAIAAVEALGRGDLRGAGPQLEGALAPLGRALKTARAELAQRMSGLHEAAAKVAESQVETYEALRNLKDAAVLNRDFVARLAEGAAEGERELPEVQQRLELVMRQLQTAAEGQQSMTTQIRETLSRARSRCRDLSQSSAELRSRLQKFERLSDALDVLDRVAARGPDALPPAERLTKLSAEARTAYTDAERRLAQLARGLDETHESLLSLVNAAPSAPADPRSVIEQPWSDASRLLIHNTERAVQALSGLQQHQDHIAASAADAARAADAGASQQDRLIEAWSQARVGSTFEEDLLRRLAAGQRELAAAEAPGAVTAQTEAALRQVQETADAAKQRLEALVRAAEQTMTILRR